MNTPNCLNFLQLCLNKNPDRRATLLQLKCHPWFHNNLHGTGSSTNISVPADTQSRIQDGSAGQMAHRCALLTNTHTAAGSCLLMTDSDVPFTVVCLLLDIMFRM
ncbi:hypothetical protein PAMP_013653 [Pampus punctatissimus]